MGVRSDDAFDGTSVGENVVRHDSKQALAGCLGKSRADRAASFFLYVTRFVSLLILEVQKRDR